MRTRPCGFDGYPEREHQTFGSTGSFWICDNPWHPTHPGACPKCGSLANHRLAGVGMTVALCTCGNQWDPGVPLQS